jgi:hypothetical protein
MLLAEAAESEGGTHRLSRIETQSRISSQSHMSQINKLGAYNVLVLSSSHNNLNLVESELIEVHCKIEAAVKCQQEHAEFAFHRLARVEGALDRFSSPESIGNVVIGSHHDCRRLLLYSSLFHLMHQHQTEAPRLVTIRFIESFILIQ